MTTRVYFRGSRDDVRAFARRLALILAGREQDEMGIRRGFLLALGFGALSDFKAAFITKARGGTDEAGVKWPPLKPETIANRRVGPRDKQNAPIAEREKIVKRETKRLLRRLRLSLPENEAQFRAKQMAQAIATRETGKTKVQTLGSRQVDMLRDTGILFNSLSPGRLSGGANPSGYSKPTAPGGSEQVFDLSREGIIVGTNVKYAATHNYGRGKIPQRMFIPERESQIPDIWWERWLGISLKAFEAGAAQLMRGGA